MADDTGRNALMTVGGAVQAIVPRSFEEAWRVAGALAASGLAPKDINTQEKCLVIIMAGAEIGMAPFQALQSFAVINGRPALYGDGMMAVARKHGVRVEESIEGTGDAMVASCTVKRPDTGEAITRAFSVADARKAGLWGKSGPWSQYPQRMLGMRARSFALRDGCADLLRGMKMVEEVQDYTEVTGSVPLIDEYDQRPPEEIAPKINSRQAKIAQIWPEIEATIRGFTDLGELEEWWANAETVTRINSLSAKWQECATEEYEKAQERLAEKLKGEIADERAKAASK